MSEEPLAHKNQPSSPSFDAEYDAIYATVSETAQGRRFLEEYARRSRPADTRASLAAIERMQMAMRAGGTSERLHLLSEIAEMAQAIARARAEIMAIKPQDGGPLEATGELDSIVQTTENATSCILAAAERIQETAWALRESGAGDTLCDRLDAQTTEIYTACSFQDLTGQRTRKVIQVLRYLEERINAMVAAPDSTPARAPAVLDLREAKLAQADVDAVMQQETHAGKERQDATLEDISRLMLALEPMMALHQETVENLAEPEPTDIASADHAEDVRPELSVAEAVAAEADEARVMAEWAVEPLAPMQPKPAAAADAEADIAEWVVEDPAAPAPRPDSEPAWMILQRLENELDAADEFEPAPAAETSPHTAQHTLLPEPALDFPASRKAADPFEELQAALETAEIKLLQPGDAVAAPVEEEPLPQTAEVPMEAPPTPEMVETVAVAAVEAPAPPAPPQAEDLAPDAAEAAAPPVSSPAEDLPARTDSDTDDFLFEPETPHQDAGKADLPIEPKPQEKPLEQTKASAHLPASEWEAGTFPDPALVTPQTARPVEDEPPKPARASYDPLAPIRAMSDEQKIALFS